MPRPGSLFDKITEEVGARLNELRREVKEREDELAQLNREKLELQRVLDALRKAR
jgi:prefoldin subunit 5